MKKRKILILIMMLILLIGLPACSAGAAGPKQLRKEGLAPYDLSEGEQHIIESFGLDETAQILSFKAPKEAISLNIYVHELGGDKSWVTSEVGAISLAGDGAPKDGLAGTFTMELGENFDLEFIVNTAGRASIKTEELSLDIEIMASSWTFLEDLVEIKLGEEIPIALMVFDSGGNIRGYSLEDYFNPSEFEKMDLIQAVTLIFSDKDI